MKLYIKQNKILFLLTILTSVIASLGYVFMAVLLQRLLDIAVEKNMQQFTGMILFSIVYFAMLGIFLYLQSLLSKKVICRIMRQVRSDVFRGTVNYSIEEFEKRNTADYISIQINIYILRSVCTTSNCLINHDFINKFVQYGWCQFLECRMLFYKLHEHIHIRFLCTHAL